MTTALARTRQRLALLATAIDNGNYLTPGDAADAILEVVLSVHQPHRADLLALLAAAGPPSVSPEPGFDAESLPDAHGIRINPNSTQDRAAVVGAVADTHPKRYLLDTYGQRTPYCSECRQSWPCGTMRVLERFLPSDDTEPF